jgi:hypothetical protein
MNLETVRRRHTFQAHFPHLSRMVPSAAPRYRLSVASVYNPMDLGPFLLLLSLSFSVSGCGELTTTMILMAINQGTCVDDLAQEI